MIRHGQGHHNLGNLLFGPKAFDTFEDARLTETGIKQANDLQETLNNIKFDKIYCSPLTRCIETCDNSINTGMEVILDDRILERQGYNLCNKRKEKKEIEKIISDCKNKYIFYNVNDKYEFEPESIEGIEQRVVSFLEELFNNNKNDSTVLLFGHQEWLNYFFQITTGEAYKFYNCELRAVELINRF